MSRQFDAIRIWIDSHPWMAWITKALGWGITHPIYSIIIVILAIFIGRQFIKALGRFLEQTFFSTLQAPFKLGKFIIGLLLKPFNKFKLRGINQNLSSPTLLGVNTSLPVSLNQKHQERMIYLLNRLEAIRQEQNDLLQEVKSILASTENSQ